jgi:hypothetical protein
MTITNRPIEEYSEQEHVVRPAKDAGNGGFRPFKLTATLKRRALKRNQKDPWLLLALKAMYDCFADMTDKLVEGLCVASAFGTPRSTVIARNCRSSG